MTRRDHWQSVYTSKAPDAVSWYRPHLERSLVWLDAMQLARGARLVDIGGGASTWVDDVLARGFESVTVLDIADAALAHPRARLGAEAHRVDWVVADATDVPFADESVDLWHDRAVFHFLTDPRERSRYLAGLRRCVRPGGAVIIGTFAPDGPERCSGLPVRRYSPEQIVAALGPGWALRDRATETHETPWGATQHFAWACCVRE